MRRRPDKQKLPEPTCVRHYSCVTPRPDTPQVDPDRQRGWETRPSGNTHGPGSQFRPFRSP
ncbi:hypothetical protein K438DRAFT_1857393 [Mycena galopus ATCC 62051]|nr:hypothetical protein K438DRAFT_1857393 [Mycena galopus ATCC 62051]